MCKREMSNPRDNYAVIVVKANRLAHLRSLFVSRPYGPLDHVFMLASHLSADKTSRFARRIAGDGISAESGPIGSGMWPLTGLK